MKYIDADCLKAEIERRRLSNRYIDTEGYESELLDIIDSLQYEQAEVQNGKFVFPKYLYARTKDNKTIDMSYAPQDMTAIEYIRADLVGQSLQQERTEGLHFTPLNRLIQKIPSGNWNDTVNNYAKKLRDCLIEEGYRKDAEVLQGYISYMNGNNVPMATMDEKEQPQVADASKMEERVDLSEETITKEFHIISDKCFNEGIEGWQKEKLIARHFYELGRNVRKEK